MVKFSKLSWIVVIIIALLPFAYFSLRLLGYPILAFLPNSQDQSFLDSTMGNWFATMVGLITGVPIGLWINKKQQVLQEQERVNSEKRISYERKSKVLILLRNELYINKQYLDLLIGKQNEQPIITIRAGMKNVLWRAFSDSGELQWVDDPSLIDKISNAYYNINRLVEYEHRYSDPYFDSAVSSLGGKDTYAGERTVKNVHALRPSALETINEAINSIDAELKL